jgi:cyclophilin family peptidyl-prolyl cis-trans isomerase/predicted DsbA family dithiol-disulfide isomerase
VKFKQVSFSIFTLVTLFTYGMLSSAHAQEKPEVVFETSKGSFTLELYADKAPNTVANFLKYVDEGFYDGTIFHRVIKDFVVQGGGFESGLKPRETREPIKSESSNRLKNLRGTIAMARRNHPDTANSQFYINLSHNSDLDYKNKYMPGYTVFGKISQGMDVVDRISAVETTTADRRGDVPVEDVKLISAKRVAGKPVAKKDKKKTESEPVVFVEGEHYVVLDRPVPTRDSSKVEVVEMFSYGCPHCYEFETSIKAWSKQQSGDVDFWVFPAVWNKSMALYAGAFYAARELKVEQKIHMPLFTAIVVEQKSIRNESDLAEFFAKHGVDKKAFTDAFNSDEVKTRVKYAEERVRLYKPVGVPEIVVNGKYRIDRMHAGGLEEMLAVADYLVKKERAGLKK